MAKLDIFPRSLCIQAIIFLCVFSYYTIITEHCISHTVYHVIGQVSRHPGEKIEMFLHGVSSILAMCSNLICFAVHSQLQ